MLHGAGAGLSGGVIGATIGALVFGLNGYGLLGLIYWLFFIAILSVIFTFLIAGIQYLGLNLKLIARTLCGALLGLVTVSLWASFVMLKQSEVNWFAKTIFCTIAAGGIVSGVLARVGSRAE
jgi:hypothetical protein